MLTPLLLAMTLTSPDVREGAMIPNAFVWNHDGCHGANRTPRLRWTAPPPGTRLLTLSVIDHDAPKPNGWLHWLVIDIPPSARSLGPGNMPPGATALENDFKALGWGGPCPPPGVLHHYSFVLTAYDAHRKPLTNATMTPVYSR